MGSWGQGCTLLTSKATGLQIRSACLSVDLTLLTPLLLDARFSFEPHDTPVSRFSSFSGCFSSGSSVLPAPEILAFPIYRCGPEKRHRYFRLNICNQLPQFHAPPSNLLFFSSSISYLSGSTSHPVPKSKAASRTPSSASSPIPIGSEVLRIQISQNACQFGPQPPVLVQALSVHCWD